MTPTFFDQLSQRNKSMMEPMMEFSHITARLYGDIFRENLKTMNDLMQCQSEHFQNLSHAKGLEEVLNAQAKWIEHSTAPICDHAQNILDTLLQSAENYNRCFEKGFKHMSKEGKDMQEQMTKMGKTFQEKATHAHSPHGHHTKDKGA